jgi:hypothetical protein
MTRSSTRRVRLWLGVGALMAPAAVLAAAQPSHAAIPGECSYIGAGPGVECVYGPGDYSDLTIPAGVVADVTITGGSGGRGGGGASGGAGATVHTTYVGTGSPVDIVVGGNGGDAAGPAHGVSSAAGDGLAAGGPGGDASVNTGGGGGGGAGGNASGVAEGVFAAVAAGGGGGGGRGGGGNFAGAGGAGGNGANAGNAAGGGGVAGGNGGNIGGTAGTGGASAIPPAGGGTGGSAATVPQGAGGGGGGGAAPGGPGGAGVAGPSASPIGAGGGGGGGGGSYSTRSATFVHGASNVPGSVRITFDACVSHAVVSVGNGSVTEGNVGDNPVINFPITVTNGSACSGLTMTADTVDGTATGGTDFVQAVGAPVAIPPGVNHINFPVVVNGDTDVEPDETFTLNLSNLAATQLTDPTDPVNNPHFGDPSAVGTILDDDDQIAECAENAPTPPGYNLILGTNGPDKLIGTKGPDIIKGLGGDDEIMGGHGDDILCGGDGYDEILGGPGNDRISGGAGNDLLIGGSGQDQIVGDGGVNEIHQ